MQFYQKTIEDTLNELKSIQIQIENVISRTEASEATTFNNSSLSNSKLHKSIKALFKNIETLTKSFTTPKEHAKPLNENKDEQIDNTKNIKEQIAMTPRLHETSSSFLIDIPCQNHRKVYAPDLEKLELNTEYIKIH